MQVINSTLEKRLSDANLKADKLTALEIEKKRFLEKEEHTNKQIE